jgi:hypothetical protein
MGEGIELQLNESHDLSYVYRIHWQNPESDLKEAFKVLLCSYEGYEQPAEGSCTWLMLACNPETPPPVLDCMSRVGHSAVVECVAGNPATAPRTLTRLSAHPDARVRIATTDNPNLPNECLMALVNDECVDVRYAIAENHNLPVCIIQLLANDDYQNPYVAHRARQTLKRLNGGNPITWLVGKTRNAVNRIFGIK